MDMLHNFSVPVLDSMDYSRDLLTPEDHHNLSHLSPHGSASGATPSHGSHASAGPAAAATSDLDWHHGSPTYSYTTSTPEDSPGVDDTISLGYEFGDFMSPQYATPTLSALISPVRNGSFYKQQGQVQSQQHMPPMQQHLTQMHQQQQHQQQQQQHQHLAAAAVAPAPVAAPAPVSATQASPATSLYSQPSFSTPCFSAPRSPSYVIPSPTQSESPSSPSSPQYITFEYSKNRTKTQYKIMSHIHSVNTCDLSADFKKDNCIYPRAAVPKEQYQGNRHQYESECNHIGWSLAHLNPCIRKKRGVIQRAVDSWRNTNPNPKFRSRRVRKLSKKTQQAAQAAAQQQQQVMMQQQRMMPYQVMQVPVYEYQQRSHSFAGQKSQW